MFCPKCGIEALESQRYCKGCGTHLQMIYDALGTSDNKGIYGIDVEALSRNARKFAESWKAGWSGSQTEARPAKATTAPVEQPRQNLPKPKEWLRYSWQHNLRDGLLSLFGGLGFGVVLYYLCRPPYIQDILRSIEPLSRTNVDIDAVARLASYIYLFAAIPVLKGLGQIIYAAFFAESIARLTERFIPQPGQMLAAPPSAFPLSNEESTGRNFDDLKEPVSSVTEHTTKIIDGAPGGVRARANE
jgi:hypothetical protein